MDLLNADEEEEDKEDDSQQLQFGEGAQNMDYIISQIEEDNIANEEIISQVEYLSLFNYESIKEMNGIFDSLVIPADLYITSQNYDPNVICIRPPYWKHVRSKRLIVKEYVDKLEGAIVDTIVENRKTTVARVSLPDASAYYIRLYFSCRTYILLYHVHGDYRKKCK